ncbi:MAG: hypothetical protein K2O52_06090, partial [Oscillospiraceae bacterium]|nr:hypothetical protein [Oscillospiraceae bacterium]
MQNYYFLIFAKKNDETLEKFILSIDKNLNSLAFPDIWLEQTEKICKEENTVLLNCIVENFCKEVEAVIALASSEKIREIAQNAMTREMTKKNSEPYPYVG